MMLFIIGSIWLFIGGIILGYQTNDGYFQYPQSRIQRYFTVIISVIILPFFLPAVILSRMYGSEK